MKYIGIIEIDQEILISEPSVWQIEWHLLIYLVIISNEMRLQFYDYFDPNVTGTRKLFQKFWTTKFHQSEFGRQEPSTKRGSWDGHTQILTCF